MATPMRIAPLALRRLSRHRVPTTQFRALCAARQKPTTSATDAPRSDDALSPSEPPCDTEQRGAIGGFMRGLMGGPSVAAEDEYEATARAEGVEPAPPPPPFTGARRSELVALKRRKREADEDGERIRDRLFSRFSGSAFMRGAFEARERISERIEESDNVVLNFFRAIYHRLFAENEMAQVVREIRVVDPKFVVSDFLADLEARHVPAIIDAYLRADRPQLKSLVTPEALEVLNASIREREHAGVTMDTNILAVSEIELSAARLLEDAPVLIVSFNVQQINCLRDKTGQVVEGKEDEIRAVYYVMAFVQDIEPEDNVPTGGGTGADNDFSKEHGDGKGRGENGAPPWKMMEMVVRGAHSTI